LLSSFDGEPAEAFDEVAAIAKKTGDADVFQCIFGFSQANAEFFKKHLGTICGH
jgi:hypothetical protein